MKSKPRLVLFVVVGTALVLALSAWLHSWGGPALVAVGIGGWLWYRSQVARGEAADQFFNDLGEETRLTGIQGGSPSEMPVDRDLVAPAPKPPHT